MSPPKVIILDFDDTLINYSEAHTISFNNLLNIMSTIHNINKNHIYDIYSFIKKNLYKLHDGKYNRHDKLLQIKLMCNELKIKDSYKYYKIYKNKYKENIKLYDDCIPFFERCNKNNIKLCIMTNNLLEIQLELYEKFKLDQYIDMIFTSNEFCFEKPHIESLKYIMEYYKIYNKNDIVIIGDSDTDIKYGTLNGVKSLLCNHNHCPDQALIECWGKLYQ